MNTFTCTASLELEGHLSDYLRHLDETIGVVLDYLLFSYEAPHADTSRLHRALAAEGMQHIADRLTRYFDKLKADLSGDLQQFPWLTPDTIAEGQKTITFDVSKATGTEISLKEFQPLYTTLFCNPPYSIQCASTEAPRLAEESLSKLLGPLRQYSIVHWSDNWSSYFDDGKEWWGAHVWTLINDQGKALWIGASATD